MDFLKDFELRFSGHKELQTLQADKFHGSVMINFSDGVPINCNLNKHFRLKYRELEPKQ